jgi:hypothetical protein
LFTPRTPGQETSFRPGVSTATMPESDHPPFRNAGGLRTTVYVGCASLLLALIAFNFVDIDIWHQMNLIRASLFAGHLLTSDPFAYTPTVHPMIDHEWGAGVIAFFFAKWMGGSGILLLKFVSTFGTLFLSIRVAERRGAGAAILTFTVPLGICLLYFGFLSSVRAQAYSFLFTATLLWALEAARGVDLRSGRRGGDRWLWAWLAIFPIWVNLHAGFIVGVGFVFLYCIEQAVLKKPSRIAIIVLCAMALEIFLNPYGASYFSYLSRALTMRRPRIPEWSPLWTLGSSSSLLFAIAMGMLIYSLAKLKSWRTPGILLLAATSVEALLHRKMLPFFAIAWLSYVPALIQGTVFGQWFEQFAQRRRRFLTLGWAALIVACMISAIRLKFWRVEVPQNAGDFSYSDRSYGDLAYPVGAVDYLAAHQFHGNIMVPFRPGAYVSWKLYPNAKVSIDSRYEVAYPNDWVERVFQFYEGRRGEALGGETHEPETREVRADGGWRETLDAYPTDLVLAPKSAPVLPLLYEVGWKPVYIDAQFELAARPGLSLPAVDRSSEAFSGVFP